MGDLSSFLFELFRDRGKMGTLVGHLAGGTFYAIWGLTAWWGALRMRFSRPPTAAWGARAWYSWWEPYVLQLGWIASWVEQISFWAGYSKVKHEENGVLVYGWRINYQLHAFFCATLPLAVLNNQDEDHSLSSDSGGLPGDLGGESDDGH